jgi:two-component system chemotaxis response regulator CheY
MLMRVLVVDDCLQIRTILAHVFRAAGVEVDEAANGQIGLARFLADPPDAVVTDINMPVMDGLTFVERLRGEPVGQSAPVFVFSSDQSLIKRRRAEHLGVRSWTEKPGDYAAFAVSVMQQVA